MIFPRVHGGKMSDQSWQTIEALYPAIVQFHPTSAILIRQDWEGKKFTGVCTNSHT